MRPSMRKVRIFCSDPDATDSSDDEDNQNPKKEKKLIGEVQVPLQKESSSSYRGVRLRDSGRWQYEIRNPVTKKKEGTAYDTEEEAAAAYQEKREKYDTKKLAMKAHLPVSEGTVWSSSSSLSCMSTPMSCKQKVQEVHNEVEVSTDTEPTDESALSFSTTFRVTSEDALLGQIDEPVSDSVVPADKPSPECVFSISDFVGVTHEPQCDYIGLADIGHLPLPFGDSELELDAEPDWSGFDLDSLERDLGNL